MCLAWTTIVPSDMRTLPARIGFLVLLAFLANREACAEKPPDKPIPPAPPLPAIRSLRLEPATLSLEDARDSRKVLVIGERTGGGVIYLTGEARLTADSPGVAVDDDGFVRATSVGDATVTITAAGHSVKLPVKVLGVANQPVGFVREIQPVLGRTGCNAGTCHGSAKGKNGFKLSLRGYDPDYDYQALINDLSGRRFNRVDVDDSLMLQKPLAEVPHEGRQAIKPGSRHHLLLRQWIAEGAHYQDPVKARATNLTILPATVKAGRYSEVLALSTDDPDQPELTIRVVALLK